MATRLRVVHLVGDHRGKARVVGQGGKLGHEPVVVWAAVMRELDREVTIGEVAGPAVRGFERRGVLTGEEAPRNLAVPAAAQPDEVASGIAQDSLDLLALEHGELLLAGQVGTRDEPRESRVAGRVAGEQHQVIARGGAGVELPGPAAARLGAADGVIQLAAATSRAQLAVIAGNRQLHADDRVDRYQARIASGGSGRLLRRLP